MKNLERILKTCLILMAFSLSLFSHSEAEDKTESYRGTYTERVKKFIQDNQPESYGNSASDLGEKIFFEPVLLMEAEKIQRELDSKLFEMVSEGDTEEASRLLKSGADVNASRTLWFTAFDENRDFAQLFLSWTPLHLASFNGDETMVELLVDNGADPLKMDNLNHLAIDVAPLDEPVETLTVAMFKELQDKYEQEIDSLDFDCGSSEISLKTCKLIRSMLKAYTFQRDYLSGRIVITIERRRKNSLISQLCQSAKCDAVLKI